MERSSRDHHQIFIAVTANPMIEQKAFAVMEPVLLLKMAQPPLAADPKLTTTVNKFAAIINSTQKQQPGLIVADTVVYMITTHRDAVMERL